MATVAQVAKASLLEILVQASEQTLQGDEYEDYIFALNNYMAELEARGIVLGYTAVANLSDVLTVAAGAIDPIVNIMAVRVAPQYGGIVSPDLAQKARDGADTLRLLGQTIIATELPVNLPYSVADEFMPCADDALTNS
jgi:hypothetical protein